MNRRTLAFVVAVSLSSMFAGTGCMPSMTIEEMKAMMPTRPVELDQLNAFIGTWDHSGTATMAGVDAALDSSGTSEVRWEGDGWYMVEQGKMTLAGFDPMGMQGVWAYDAKAKVFRTNWVDTMGSFGVGTVRYDSKKDMWHMKAKSHMAFGTSTGKGTVKFVDKDTQEWVWAEYAMGGLFKTMEMQSTSKRRR